MLGPWIKQGKLNVVKQEKARMNIDMLGIRKLNGQEQINLIQMTIVSTNLGSSRLEEME